MNKKGFAASGILYTILLIFLAIVSMLLWNFKNKKNLLDQLKKEVLYGDETEETCPYEINQEFNFDYTGNIQEFTPECSGNYKLEVWGASGGDYNSSYLGGKGGYSSGTINLIKDANLFIYVGGRGTGTANVVNSGGFNGGGDGSPEGGSSVGASGGGASDIRIGTDSLYARVIVAGGGGGAYSYSSTYSNGGYGGGATGGSTTRAGGGTSTSAGNSDSSYSNYGTAGSFGLGGTSVKPSSIVAGGGGGWYGGGFGVYPSGGGGGGSGYIYTESTAANYPSGCLLNSSYYLTDASTTAGNQTFKAPNGTDETGHIGNGYARITYLGNN